MICSLPLLQSTYAQTNTFPSSGNVGIGKMQPEPKLQVEIGIIFSKNRFIHAQNGRLKAIRDQDGKLVEEYQYHYRNQ